MKPSSLVLLLCLAGVVGPMPAAVALGFLDDDAAGRYTRHRLKHAW